MSRVPVERRLENGRVSFFLRYRADYNRVNYFSKVIKQKDSHVQDFFTHFPELWKEFVAQSLFYNDWLFNKIFVDLYFE